MRRSLLALAVLACVGCTASPPPTPPAPPPMPKATLGAWGVDLGGMDRSVKPGDNFFDYVNGVWYKKAVIPADRSSTGSFQNLQILSEKRMRDIVDGLEAKPYASLTPEERKLRDLYDAFVNEKQIDVDGLKPVQADLAYLAHLKTKADVARAMASTKLGTESVFDVGIGIDDKNPDAYSINLGQSGLGMPDRDYYLRDDKALVATRDAYSKYLTDMLTLAGFKNPEARAAKIYAVEKEIAEVSWTRADRRDEDKVYNPMPYPALKKLAPQFPWDAFFKEAGIPLKSPKGDRQVIVAEKSAFPKIAAIFGKTPVSVWRDYLAVHYLHVYAPYLPKKFDDTNFVFYGTVLGGRTAQLDRPTRGVHLLDNLLGEALGKLYVAKYFPPEAKAKALDLVHNLLKAYEQDIQTLAWMTPETRAKALDKLHHYMLKIGYPDKWRDYSAYKVVPGELVADVQAGNEFEWNRELKRLDNPVDKAEWGMTPPTINAYYNPSFNEIVFPAAILQPPFFDPNADDAVNYGGIGAVIGHEISHGFDDQGSKYTGAGVLQDWWTAEDRKNFDQRTTELADQYDAYEPLPGLHIIGKNVLGEAIADLAGLTIAEKAYHLSLDGKQAPVLDSYTGDQRFFLSYGQIWRTKMRDSALRTQTLSNEHAVAEFRVIGTTRNVDGWYKAFDITPSEKYYLPEDKRVKLW
ncbi:MAG: M13 family metallopeptidase [Alphaproteobacteria bacterium]|nr:M13 family metallopeptidase [Alphaproteobacteria bacterium]MDE2110860.1 M13 family metallopeptidase [Alphaproteobacteria bacterium]MDE2495466.1 M13 family metallopeptidase [Alphaproteobacteria bacterium]